MCFVKRVEWGRETRIGIERECKLGYASCTLHSAWSRIGVLYLQWVACSSQTQDALHLKYEAGSQTIFQWRTTKYHQYWVNGVWGNVFISVELVQYPLSRTPHAKNWQVHSPATAGAKVRRGGRSAPAGRSGRRHDATEMWAGSPPSAHTERQSETECGRYVPVLGVWGPLHSL
jgi:hypothetical protein